MNRKLFLRNRLSRISKGLYDQLWQEFKQLPCSNHSARWSRILDDKTLPNIHESALLVRVLNISLAELTDPSIDLSIGEIRKEAEGAAQYNLVA